MAVRDARIEEETEKVKTVQEEVPSEPQPPALFRIRVLFVAGGKQKLQKELLEV